MYVLIFRFFLDYCIGTSENIILCIGLFSDFFKPENKILNFFEERAPCSMSSLLGFRQELPIYKRGIYLKCIHWTTLSSILIDFI